MRPATVGEPSIYTHAPNGTLGDVSRQIGALLLTCQRVQHTPYTFYVPRALTAQVARLTVLANMANTLTSSEALRLLNEINTLEDISLRTDLLARVAAHLPPSKQRDVVDQLLGTVGKLKQAEVRAGTLFRLFPLINAVHNTPPTSFLAVLNIALSIANPEARIRSLIALSRYVPSEMRLPLQRRLLEMIDLIASTTARTNALATLAETLVPELSGQALVGAMRIKTPEERARAVTALARTLPNDLVSRVHEDILDTIASIKGEERCTEALIAFAPHLEYVENGQSFPRMLEKALKIAIGLSNTTLRAHALTVLVPNMTQDLQAEALAAVLALPDNADRASLLANLAEHLPATMLRDTLDKALAIEDPSARLEVLVAFAQHLPQPRQIAQHALESALALPHAFERIAALVNLVNILPESIRPQIIEEALEAAADITNPNTRSRAITMLADHVPTSMLPKALALAHELDDPQKQIAALAALFEYAAEDTQDEIMAEMLQIVQEVRFEFRRSRALLTIAHLIPATMISKALKLARTIHDPYDRLSAIIALAQNTNPAQRPALVGEAWRLVRQVEDGYDRASALAAIAPLLPPAAEEDLTKEVSIAIKSIADEYDQASAILMLAPLLATGLSKGTANKPDKVTILSEGLRAVLQVPDMHERARLFGEGVQLWISGIDRDDRTAHDRLWMEVMQRLERLPLPDTMLCLGQLPPLVQHIANEHAAQEIVQALGLPV